MQKRLPSLDGLRGFAALAVVLSHIPVNLIEKVNSPVFNYLFGTIAAGPNSVQILFVLTGFLMSYLYPNISHALSFIQKRYTRIFPIFVVVVLFFWLVSIGKGGSLWFVQLVVFLALAVTMRISWKLMKKIDTFHVLGKSLFYVFLMFQSAVLVFLVFILPRLLLRIPESSFLGSIITMLANITLTMPFSVYTKRLNIVFWSLTPEVLFYLCFPFFVVPLINIAKKWGYLVGIILVICATKILFDLDHEVMYTGGLLVVNIARASGFVAGAVIGTIYQQKKKLWNILEKILKNPGVSFFVLFLFIAFQWGDRSFRDAGSVTASNYYFLVSSWVIAVTILTALIPQTPIYKIFSNKILVFLGMISYSLYLSHLQVIEWVTQLLAVVKNFLPPFVYLSIFILLTVGLSVGLARVLFYLVESLYFTYRKKEKLENSFTKKMIYKKESQLSSWFVAGSMSVFSAVILLAYVGRYTPSLLIARHTIISLNVPKNSQESLLKTPVRIPFTAISNNLSIVSMDLQYKNKADETRRLRKQYAQLVFTLFTDKQQKIFESHIDAFTVEGNPHYQFGFPTIPDSLNRKYIAQLSLEDGTVGDQIIVDTSPTNFISLYTMQGIKPPLKIPVLFWNRWIFALHTPESLFVIVFMFSVILFYTKIPEYVAAKNMLFFPKRVFAYVTNKKRDWF